MGLFGAKRRRTREIAHEVLKPLGLEEKDLKETSGRDFHAAMRRVVELGKDDELYRRQDGWQRDESVDAVARRHRR